MHILKFILGNVAWLALGGAVLWFAYNLLRLWLVHRREVKEADDIVGALSESDLALIRQRVREPETTAIKSYRIYQKTAETDDQRHLIQIPAALSNLPWAGQCLQFLVDQHSPNGVHQVIRVPDADIPDDHIQLGGGVFELVPVPTATTKSGKIKNRYQVEYFPKSDPAIRKLIPAKNINVIRLAFERILPIYSFANGLDEFRIGGSFSWLQNPEYPKCPICKKTMIPVCQLPGLSLNHDKIPERVFYVSGCKQHTDQFDLRWQCT